MILGMALGAAWFLSANAMDQTAPARPSVPAAAAPPASPTASGGCGSQGKHLTGVFRQTTTDGKQRSRTMLIQVPTNYDSAKPYALYFVFHAAGGNASQSFSWGLQTVPGAGASGIFVFPEGIAYQNEGVGWDDTRNGYDMPLFDNMVKDLQAEFCIDTSRVFAAGFSWGGDFVTALACLRGSVIRAAAANSTTDEYKDKNNYLTYQNLPCPATAHPAVRFEHAVGGDPQYPPPFFATTSKLYQHLNGCAATSANVTAASSPIKSCAAYDSCKSPLLECSFNANLGHALPPNWAADTWAFFSSFK
jgi:poly(3-hydroxybutyrate) depolymerase